MGLWNSFMSWHTSNHFFFLCGSLYLYYFLYISMKNYFHCKNCIQYFCFVLPPKHTVIKKSKTKLTHISRRKSFEVMTNLGKPTTSRESCNSWFNPCKSTKPATMLVYTLCRQPSCTMTCLFHEESPVGLYDMNMLFRRPSCSMTCLLYEENSVGFYGIFTLCRQPCWSPWLVYFLKRILMYNAGIHLGLHDMFTFWEESCCFL